MTKRVPYGPGEAEAILAAVEAGESRRAIAERFGRTEKAVTRLIQRRRSAGAEPRPRPDDRPNPQNGMTGARWIELLERRLAGEGLKPLTAEYGVSPDAAYKQAAKRRMRLRDRPGARGQPKGPPPVVLEAAADGEGLNIVCADMAFRFHRDDPVATVHGIYDCLETMTAAGDEPRAMRLTRLGNGLLILSERVDRTIARRGAQGQTVDPDDAPREAHRLHEAQTPPEGDWRTWLFLGGRGAGKTLAGAEWLADQAELLGEGGRVALIGPTLHDVREVMIEGVSGLRSLPRWTRRTRPVYQPSRRRLYFENGCLAYAFSAEDPDSLRGPQFSAAWADELCAWPAHGARGAAETLAMLRMGLRLPLAGAAPRLAVTTTPRPTRALIRLRDEPACVLTHAPTSANAAHLSAGFIDDLKALYGGTRHEAQELDGQIVDLDGALFTAEMMRAARSPSPARPLGGSPPHEEEGDPYDVLRASRRPPGRQAPPGHPEGYDRIILALDPPATAGGDACGLIAAARRVRPDGKTEAVILADRTAHGLSPDQWARRALATAEEFGAAALVAEVNQGGDMVGSVLRAAGITLPVVPVRAATSKRARAEPVAALYEQGRVKHLGAFEALEEELMLLGGEMEGTSSLDRADALVWAVTHLLVDKRDGPRVRRL